MNFDLDKLLEWLNGLYGLPMVTLVFIGCLAFGFVLKRLPMVPNGAIPMLVALAGAVLLPLGSDWHTSQAKSVRVFIVQNVLIGLVVGTVATLVHRLVLKRLFAKFGLDNGDSDPRAFVKSDLPPAATILPPNPEPNQETKSP